MDDDQRRTAAKGEVVSTAHMLSGVSLPFELSINGRETKLALSYRAARAKTEDDSSDLKPKAAPKTKPKSKAKAKARAKSAEQEQDPSAKIAEVLAFEQYYTRCLRRLLSSVPA